MIQNSFEFKNERIMLELNYLRFIPKNIPKNKCQSQKIIKTQQIPAKSFSFNFGYSTRYDSVQSKPLNLQNVSKTPN